MREWELWLNVIALIVAGILAISALIISKKPSAKELIDKLVPYQGFIGVGLLVYGLINVIRVVPHLDAVMAWKLGGVVTLLTFVTEVFLGFLFGMPLIAKWIPGESPAEQ